MSILDDLNTIYDTLDPPLYYVVLKDGIERGKVLQLKGDAFYPPVLIMHYIDFAEQGAFLSTLRRMVDFHTWQPTNEDAARAAKAWFDEQRGKPILLRDEDEELYRFTLRPRGR